MTRVRLSNWRKGIIPASVILLICLGLGIYWMISVVMGAPKVRTTAELVAESAGIQAEDRPRWIRLARNLIEAENIQPIVSPVEPTNNRGESSRVELGYQLFFDPVLSGDGSTSCASCHHPEYGMADGLPHGIGVGGTGYGPARAGTGKVLPRNTPSVFNAAFNTLQFWDGRAGTLEEQALIPIFAEDEMNQHDVAAMLRRLRTVRRYRELFAAAFGLNSRLDGSEITLLNIARAIAAFERKLNIMETPYDRFVGGDDTSLTTGQLRGFVLFVGRGACVSCHIPPRFHDGGLSSTGVPVSLTRRELDGDPGFGAVVRRQDAFGQFKTPGLRNVSRTAPYMHNGIFNTLEEIVDFYNDGGGRGLGIDVSNQDAKVGKLNLNPQERRDLVDFLKSLDSLQPTVVVPATAPSRLPVVGRMAARRF